MNRKLIKDLMGAIKASDRKKTSGYDTSAVVRRIEDGTAWVHIPGGVDETPVKLTINASVGDTVQVRVSGGRAFLVGNRTAPPTDDTTAIKATYVAKNAQETAVEAKSEASEAWNYAGTAKEAAESAQDSADSAAEAAIEAWNHADDAHQAAVSANNSANNALTQLSVVEDVAGTLRWISEHGDFVLTNDNRVREGTVYFVYENGDYVPIANPDPSANPSTEGWYILDVTESQSKYIMSHLAVTSAGLWVLPVDQIVPNMLTDSEGNQLVDSDGNELIDYSTENPQYATGYKVLLSGTGMSVFNDEGAVVANYGTTTTIGESSKYNVHITNRNIQVRNGSTVLARYGSTVALGENGDVEIGVSSTGAVRENFDNLSGDGTVSVTVAHTIAGGVSITGMGWGESGFEPVAISSSDYTRSGKTITINNPPTGSSVTLSSVSVFYITSDKVTQMAIGVNYDDENAINFPLVVGNNNYDLYPSNQFSVAWNGEIRSRSHYNYIGEIVRASSSFNSNISAGIDLYQNVATMTLNRGTWVVFAQFGVSPSGNVSGCLALRFCVGNVAPANVVDQSRQLGNANTGYFSAINATTILTIEQDDTPVYAIASCHYSGTVSARDFKAVCIS